MSLIDVRYGSTPHKAASADTDNRKTEALRYPCPEWDSNPSSHCLIGQGHYSPCVARPPKLALTVTVQSKRESDVYKLCNVPFEVVV
jgi:hypothetical protein